MKKLVTVAILIGAFIAVTVSCKMREPMPSETMAGLPGADAQAFYTYITTEAPYKNWKLWPGTHKLYEGSHPHGAYLTTYVNGNALSSIRANKPMIQGSMIVKENYTPGKKLDALTIMYKIKGYNPAAGNWFWAKYNGTGRVLMEGKVRGCIDCHSSMKKNDYLFTEQFVEKREKRKTRHPYRYFY